MTASRPNQSVFSESDIPGYMYDSTTNRYFKIPPPNQHFSQLPGACTKTHSQSSAEPHQSSPVLSIFSLTQKRSLTINQEIYTRVSLFKGIAASFQCVDSKRAQFCCECVKVALNGEMIMGVWCAEHLYDQLNYRVSVGHIQYTMKSAVDISWYGHPVPSEPFVCDISTGSDGRGLFAILVDYNHPHLTKAQYWTDQQQKHITMDNVRVKVQQPSTVCVSQDCVQNYTSGTDGELLYAVGSEKGYVFSIRKNEGRMNVSRIYVKRLHSSVCSLAYGIEASHQLFAGYQNGEIHSWDLRGPHHCRQMKEDSIGKINSTVTALQPLRDGNYIITSAYNSKLSLWDMRMCKKVLQYKEHVNFYRPCRSKLIDLEEKFVFAAGSENCVRIWSLGDGELLRTITPDECPCRSGGSVPSPPVFSYSDTLGGKYEPTLIVCNHETLSFFRL